MKKKGAICDFRAQRDRDLYRAYCRTLDNTHSPFRLPTVIQQVLKRPAERFYVSEERAAIVITEMMKGKSIASMQVQKRRMYNEIYRRFRRVKRAHPAMSLQEAITIVVNQPAPEFYLTVGSAIVILHRIRKQMRMRT